MLWLCVVVNYVILGALMLLYKVIHSPLFSGDLAKLSVVASSRLGGRSSVNFDTSEVQLQSCVALS